MRRRFTLLALVPALIAAMAAPALASPDNRGDNGPHPRTTVYVRSQGLYFDSIVLGDLPQHGPFQKLEMGDKGLETDFGPGDVGYVGGRWWLDANGGQVVLQWWGDCAARGLQTLQPDGSGAWIAVEPSGAHWIHARVGDALVVHSIGGCGDPYGPVSLISPDGSLVRTLVPQVAGYQGVISIAGMVPLP